MGSGLFSKRRRKGRSACWVLSTIRIPEPTPLATRRRQSPRNNEFMVMVHALELATNDQVRPMGNIFPSGMRLQVALQSTSQGQDAESRNGSSEPFERERAHLFGIHDALHGG